MRAFIGFLSQTLVKTVKSAIDQSPKQELSSIHTVGCWQDALSPCMGQVLILSAIYWSIV